MTREYEENIRTQYRQTILQNPLLFGIARAQQQGDYPSHELMLMHMVVGLQAQITKHLDAELRRHQAMAAPPIFVTNPNRQ